MQGKSENVVYVEEECQLFRSAVVELAEEICGMRGVGRWDEERR